MNASLSSSAIQQSLKHFMQRFHLVLFVLILAGGLAVAIFTLNTIIARSQQQNDTDVRSSFDTETIERINQLKTRNDSESQIELPSGRINPFVE